MGVKNMMAFLLLVMGTNSWGLKMLFSSTSCFCKGLFVSSVTLEIRNLQRRKRELEEEKMIQKIEF